MGKPTTHDAPARSDERGGRAVAAGRSLAWSLTVVFLLVGLAPVALSDGPPRLWSLAVAGTFLGLGLVVPGALYPLEVLWMRLRARRE